MNYREQTISVCVECLQGVWVSFFYLDLILHGELDGIWIEIWIDS